MAKLFSSSGDPYHMPQFAVFASYPFVGFETKIGQYLWNKKRMQSILNSLQKTQEMCEIV